MVVLRTLKKDNCMSFVQFLVNYMFICFHIHYVDKDRLVRHGREGWFVIYLFFLVAEFELNNFSTKCDHCLLHFSILLAFLINTICHKF